MNPVAARRTRAQQRAHHRDLLIGAFHSLLRTEEYSRITVDRILAASGVARATFYTNFSDKAALLMAVAEDIYAEALGVAEPWWSLPADATRADLQSALVGIIDLYLSHRPALAAMAEASAFEPPIRTRLVALQQGSIEKLTHHIDAGQRAGDIRAALIPRETAGWLIWMIERGLYQMASLAGADELGRLAISLTDIIWHTLYLRSESP